MVELLKQFLNLTNFSYLSLLEVYLLLLTIFAERNAAVLKIAPTLKEYCFQTSEATAPGFVPFQRSLLNL